MHDFDYEALKSEGEDDIGSDYVFLIFSQFSQILTHKRNWHKKKMSNFPKFQFLNDKIYSFWQNLCYGQILSFNNYSFAK